MIQSPKQCTTSKSIALFYDLYTLSEPDWMPDWWLFTVIAAAIVQNSLLSNPQIPKTSNPPQFSLPNAKARKTHKNMRMFAFFIVEH